MSNAHCSIDGCNLPHRGRGYCQTHYMRWYRYGDPLRVPQKAPNGTYADGVKCEVEGCSRQAKTLGMCHMHYFRMKNHNDPDKVVQVYRSTPERRKEQALERQRRYRATPHGRARMRFNNAKARAFAGYDTGISKEEFEALLNIKTCGLCGEPFKTDEEKTLDHIIPLSLGGKNELKNLTVAHGPCNSSKGNRGFGLSGQWSSMLEAIHAGD